MKQNVLSGSIGGHMFRLALPSVGGMFAITAFNLTDTFFVSKLGTASLAAMGFTFPVVMILGTLSSGISLGAGSVLARAMGSGDSQKMSRIATDGILLSILMVLIVSIPGYLTTEWLFHAIGAEGEALDQVVRYMKIWYLGAAVIMIPPISDSSMRAMGDMVRPLWVMVLCALVNVILDPILIFGYFGVPAMGIEGAAYATIIARAVGMVLSLSFVHFHYKLIRFDYSSLRELFESWKAILQIGIPNIFVRLIPQLTRAVMTKLAAGMTVGAVAAIAAGQRIESFAIVISMAVGVSIVPIVGQNFGAGKFERVHEMRKLLISTAWIYGILLIALAIPFGKAFAHIFSAESEVIALTTQYIKIIFIGSIGLNQYNWISEAFNAAGKPRFSLIINSVGTLLIILPALWIGAVLDSFRGMLLGLTLGQMAVGVLAMGIAKRYLTPPENLHREIQ
jgi:putative MATE family efflux protein